jgi:hypothetical protein
MNELVITTEDGTFIFVTREGVEPFTLEEAKQHLGERKSPQLSFPDKPLIPNKDAEFDGWHIPDDKMRRHMFRKDLQNGVQFCMDKYGQTQEAIEAEARRLAMRGF